MHIAIMGSFLIGIKLKFDEYASGNMIVMENCCGEFASDSLLSYP